MRPGGTYVVCLAQRPAADDEIGNLIASMSRRVDAETWRSTAEGRNRRAGNRVGRDRRMGGKHPQIRTIVALSPGGRARGDSPAAMAGSPRARRGLYRGGHPTGGRRPPGDAAGGGSEKGDGRGDRIQARRSPSMTTDNILACEHLDSLLAISQVPITRPRRSAISISARTWPAA